MRRPVLKPGHSHPITVQPAGRRVRVSFAGRRIADTDRALVLTEASYPERIYVPLDDVDPAVLQPSSHTSYCPYKGEASYYSLSAGEHTAENAVWSYADPHEAVQQIAGHVAFYPQHVDLELV